MRFRVACYRNGYIKPILSYSAATAGLVAAESSSKSRRDSW
jgi:hypothetical protein